MDRAWKIIGAIAAVLVIGAVGFCIAWTARNWKTVYSAMDGSSIYTDADMKESYQTGYAAGTKNETEYQNTVAELRDLVANLQVDNTTLTNEAAALNYLINENENRIAALTEQKNVLEARAVELENVNDENAELRNQIADLEEQIAALTLTNQITESRITELNNRIAQLQENIVTYQNYIANLAITEDQVVVTFELAGAVTDIQIVDKGSVLTLPIPDNTDNYIFNGWQIDGAGDLLDSTYTVTANTKIVADVTYKYIVNFVNGTEIHDSQRVLAGSYAIVPVEPTKAGDDYRSYQFKGWSINGVDVIDNIIPVNYVDTIYTPVTANTTYYAVYENYYTVNFWSARSGEIIATQTVKEGECATVPQVTPTSDGYEFIGWSATGNESDIVNVGVVPIVNYTIYKPVFKKYHTVSFVLNWDDVGDVEKTGYETLFEWQVLDGQCVNHQIQIWVKEKVFDALHVDATSNYYFDRFVTDDYEYRKQYTTSPDITEPDCWAVEVYFDEIPITKNSTFRIMVGTTVQEDKPIDLGNY